MNKQRYPESTAEKSLHLATAKSLDKFNKAVAPYREILFSTIARAWSQYEKDIAAFESTCHNEIANASRQYSYQADKETASQPDLPE